MDFATYILKENREKVNATVNNLTPVTFRKHVNEAAQQIRNFHVAFPEFGEGPRTLSIETAIEQLWYE